MKRSKKIVLWCVFLLLCAVFSIYFIVRIFQDPSRLTPTENEWVNENLNRVQNVSVLNDTNIFGKNGHGVFYDFLSDFSDEYGIRINSITYRSNETVSGIFFEVANAVDASDVNFYQDHYVLISKTNEAVDLSTLPSKKVGVLSSDVSYLTGQMEYVPSFVSYANRSDLLAALDSGNDIQAVLVPRIEYIDTILSKDYRIIYHYTNIARYYNLSLDDSVLSSIFQKYFLKWKQEDLKEDFHSQEFDAFISALGINQTEVDQLQSVEYNYGFLNNSPYEVLTGGNYGGILASYLSEFSEFSSVEFNFKRYRNYKKLANDIEQGKVDLYFGYQNFTTPGTLISSDILLNYDVLAHESVPFVVSSLKSLYGKTVYVEENSLLYSKISTNTNIHVETYSGEKGLKEVVKKKGILFIDHSLSLYYQQNILKHYSLRYTSHYPDSYPFRSNANSTFNTLFMHYVDYLDENEMNYIGLYNHAITIQKGTILGTIARYFLYILLVFFVLGYLIYRSSRKIRVATKIRKEDKMKFIDQLTSLKNRNYLNENISKWNKNTIYPQTMIVIDLNRIQEINDTIGYEQGDNQIKAAANVLIRAQLDNSDVMRTDGNEFMIYLIGYQAKQITAYIHKLNKEFKNLPYEYGACIGYSMIVDDVKSIEDAINEATLDVKKQKEMQKEDFDEK